MLAGVIGLGAVGLGLSGLRQVRQSAGRVTGRGLAVSGLVCGAAGVALTVLAMGLAFLVAASSG